MGCDDRSILISQRRTEPAGSIPRGHGGRSRMTLLQISQTPPAIRSHSLVWFEVYQLGYHVEIDKVLTSRKACEMLPFRRFSQYAIHWWDIDYSI